MLIYNYINKLLLIDNIYNINIYIKCALYFVYFALYMYNIYNYMYIIYAIVYYALQ